MSVVAGPSSVKAPKINSAGKLPEPEACEGCKTQRLIALVYNRPDHNEVRCYPCLQLQQEPIRMAPAPLWQDWMYPHHHRFHDWTAHLHVLPHLIPMNMHGKKKKQLPNSELDAKPLSVKTPKISGGKPPEPAPCKETSLDFIKRLNVNKASFQQLPTPVKSPMDKKEYKVIRLANGLTACLISDPSVLNDDDEEEEEDEEEDGSGSESETDESGADNDVSDEGDKDSVPERKVPEQKMAAAALCVGVGSFSDPEEFLGMAHFLEHMVFMGSKKYPQENDFDAFISNRGGSNNACTDLETTTFCFECLKKHLYQGLDRFAQFFISPLMLRDSITREREAIDSEFQRALPSDGNRKEQLLASLAKKDSPVNTFSWGNMKTLRDNVKDSELYKALHKFRKRHYSAHRMTLAIQAGLPMELLEAYVLDCFSKVPCNDQPPLDFTMFKDVYGTPEWNRIYFIEPIKDDDTLEITFALPSLLEKYKTKPHYYVSGILGDEGKGSLMSYLRKKVWALELTTGNSECGSEHNKFYSFFAITIRLTAEGLQNLFTIIELVFSFINLLKTVGPQKRIYDEMKQIEDISFRFAAEQSVDENVENMAERMHFFPPEDYLIGPNLFYEYDPQGINMVMEHLEPSKANITVTTKSASTLDPPVRYDKTEPWFGTRYTDIPITEERLLRWKLARPLDEFALPLPNQFITADFEILPPCDDVHPEFPVKIFKGDALEVWHRKDEKFGLPMAVWYINLVAPLVVVTTKNKAMLDFYVSLMEMQVAEEAWPADNAELRFYLKARDNGISIKVHGLNEKLPILIDLLLKYLKSFTSNLTKETFAAVKDERTREFHNELLKPAALAKDIRLDAILKKYHSLLDKFKVISEITFEDVKTFGEQLLRHLYIRVLVQGNVSVEQATLVAQNIVRQLNCEPIHKDDYPLHSTMRVPDGRTICRVKSLNKFDSNSVVLNYYQGNDYTIETEMVLEMWKLLLEEPLFNTLRTREQLGYSVHCSVHHTHGVLGFSVTVQSPTDKYSTRHVDERIEAFMKRALQLLRDTPEEEFEETKSHLIKTKQCGDNSLEEEAVRNWNEIMFDTYKFDRIKLEVKGIEKLKRSDLLDWWKENIYCDVEDKFTYRMLSIQIVGHSSQEAATQESDDKMETNQFALDFIAPDGAPDARYITDLGAFRETCTVFPQNKDIVYMV